MRTYLLSGQERGDTLIEVTIATAILSAVLISVFTIANVASVTGRVANQRGDAVALEQQQAEILRNYRDNTLLIGSWTTFTTYVFDSGSGSTCPIMTETTKKLPTGVGSNSQTLGAIGMTVKTSSGEYFVDTTACYVSDPLNPKQKINFETTATWDRAGTDQKSTLSTSLSNVGSINQVGR